MVLTQLSRLIMTVGILFNAFDSVEERLEKCLPPTQDQFSQAEAVFPLTPPLSDDSDASDGSYFKGRTYVKTICSGDTTEKRSKRSRNRPAIQRHREFNKKAFCEFNS